MFQCYHVLMGNQSNSKFLRRAVIAEWLTHLTISLGYPVRVSPAPSFERPLLDVNACLGVFLLPTTVKRCAKGLKTRE